MQKKLHIKKGDTVVVLAGNDNGRQGKVLEVIRDKDRAIVEGVNMIKKHTKPNAENPQGGIVEKEAPIHISNLMLVVITSYSIHYTKLYEAGCCRSSTGRSRCRSWKNWALPRSAVPSTCWRSSPRSGIPGWT